MQGGGGGGGLGAVAPLQYFLIQSTVAINLIGIATKQPPHTMLCSTVAIYSNAAYLPISIVVFNMGSGQPTKKYLT